MSKKDKNKIETDDKNNKKDIQLNESKTNETENFQIVETKNEKNTLTINQQKELETIENEIKEQEIKSQEKMSKTYTNVFKNILYAIIVILYFILSIIGYNLIEQNMYRIVLKVFSMVLIITTICIFEKAYKKDSGKLTITGIEFLMLSICTLLSIRAYIVFYNKFVSLVTSFALLFAIYYVGKAIAIYSKEKNQVKREVRNMNTITKKEVDL